ncbi:MAG: hypothetical protein K6F01_12740 [Selenomonas sp.]|uniref:hypothetical protein n=1 Tax=Selenomonas sp. TaxID=2053611 RepID=UPI0025F52006|nr:hypothetical protein [Selenomonas sp.]MCR5440283.1 hypothetical protein [Selenomonas sp.]
MSKGKIIIEVKKIDEDVMNASVKILNLSMNEVSNAIGAALNDVIGQNSDSKIEEIFFKIIVIRDICNQMGLGKVANSLDEIIQNWDRTVKEIEERESNEAL